MVAAARVGQVVQKRVVDAVFIKGIVVTKSNGMKTPNRDLLVLLKDEFRSEISMECELEQLNEILFRVETVENFCAACEVFDLNKYTIITSNNKLYRILSRNELKPFQFIVNKN